MTRRFLPLPVSFAVALLATLGAQALQARTASSVVMGDTAESCDCPETPTPSPTPSPVPPTATPLATETPVNKLRQDIENLGFPVQWEGEVLLVTLADESTRFDSAKATLKDASIQRLESLAAVLVRYAGNKIRVDGHTDAAGKPEFNRRLSLKRAQVVQALLSARGVPKADFEAVEGHGPDLPVGDNATEEGKAMNRRVELRLRFHALAASASGPESSAWVSGTAAVAPSPESPTAAVAPSPESPTSAVEATPPPTPAP